MKRKFVKVMFFGALALVSTAVTSCKDYDDDVKNLQEQIDKITSTSPVSSEELKAAVDKAKSELTELLNKKADITALEKEIQDLKDALAKGGDEALLADLAKQLADKTNLLTWENLKTDETIAKLKTDIDALNKVSSTLDALVKAEQKYKESGDLSGFDNTSFDALINNSIKEAIEKEGDIAAYVQGVVQKATLADFKAINNEVSTLTGGVWKSMEAFITDCYTLLYDKEDGILARLTELEKLQEAVDAFIKENDNYEKYADILNQIEASRQALTALSLPAGSKNLTEAIEAIIKAQLKEEDSSLASLKKKLQDEINAIKKMVQSVSFVPKTSDRIVNFTTLYAKSKAADANYGTITLDGASTQEVMFRISPADAAESFVDNYDVTFSADREMTRAVQVDQFVVVDKPVVDGGLVTYTIKSNATKSFAVCMHVVTKEDKVETLGKTDITSDYFAAIVGKKYLVDAYYKANSGADVDMELPYDVKDGKAEYNGKGRVVLSVSNSADGTTPSEVELSEYPGFDPKSLTTTFSVVNDTYFKVSGTAVMLNAYETPSYIGQVTDVNAKVTAAGFYTPAADKKIGTVTVTKTTKKATIDYGKIEPATWSNGAQTVAASKFPLNKIYDAEDVKLTLTEFQALTGEVVKEVTDKVYFAISTDLSSKNELTAVIAAQTPAGVYPIKAKFTSDGREIIVTATITVQNPEIAELAVDKYLWGGTATAGKVGFTPTLDQEEKPFSITLSYDLSKLFTNYSAVQAAVTGVTGATLKIDVPNWNKIKGISYSEPTLTFKKDEYTGKTTDGKDAKVQIVATVTLAGTTTPLQKLTADVNINDISGSWVAGKKAVELNSKAGVYPLADGFSWNDMRGKAMWKDGSQVDDQVEFGTATPLAIYGLTAPSFKFVDAEGKDTTCPYLTVGNDGKLSFTTTGKGYNFQTDYTAYVMIVASSQWGTITNYANNNVITVTIPANVK